MSCDFESVPCPKCGRAVQFVGNQEQAYCGMIDCGIYFNRSGEIERYDKIRSSATPFFKTLEVHQPYC